MCKAIDLRRQRWKMRSTVPRPLKKARFWMYLRMDERKMEPSKLTDDRTSRGVSWRNLLRTLFVLETFSVE